jgi:hypothetical protein
MIFRITALGIGALAMYYFDPASGKRRRTLLRDKLVHYRHEAGHLARGTLKHARNKAQGVAHDLREKAKPEHKPEQAQERWPVDVELR